MDISISRIDKGIKKVEIQIHRCGLQLFCIPAGPYLVLNKFLIVDVSFHNLQESLVRFNGFIKQFIDQVSIPQVVEYIGWCSELLVIVFFIGRIYIFACFDQVFNGFILLIGIIQQADSNLVVEVVIPGIMLQKLNIEGQGIAVLFKKEPGFGVQKNVAEGIPLRKQ